MSLCRLIGAVHAIAVELAGEDIRQISVPHHVGLFAERDPLGLLGGFGESNRHSSTLAGVFGVQGEIRSAAVPSGPQRIGPTRPDAHDNSSTGVDRSG